MVGGWIKPYLTLESKRALLQVSIKTENFEDPDICFDCISSVYRRLGKIEVDRVFWRKGRESRC
jgi:hypothetical protein